MDKLNIKLGIIFSAVFVLLMLYYYTGKPTFILEDKDAAEKKVSTQKSIMYGLGVSTVATLLAYLVLTKMKTPEFKFRMAESCNCK